MTRAEALKKSRATHRVVDPVAVAAAARDASGVATCDASRPPSLVRDASRTSEPLQTRQLPAVPAWVQHPEKWVMLSRTERRALERHHRRQQHR